MGSVCSMRIPLRIMTFSILVCCQISACSKKASKLPDGTIVVEAASEAVAADGTVVQAIGIETLGGVFTPVIRAGAKAPVKHMEIFSTAADNQDQVTIGLYRGSAQMVKDSTPMGKYQISGIGPAPRGIPQLEVTFSVKDGQILLAARDKLTAKPMPLRRLADQGTVTGKLVIENLPAQKQYAVSLHLFPAANGYSEPPYGDKPPADAFPREIVVKTAQDSEDAPLVFRSQEKPGFYHPCVSIHSIQEAGGKQSSQVQRFFPMDRPVQIKAFQERSLLLKATWQDTPPQD